MAGSVNKVILVGNLGKDPEVRTAQSGSKIVNLAIATSETWNDKASGERKEKTEWHRVVIFNDRLAEVAEKYGRKGRKVYIEGSLQTRKWTDQSGQEKYSTEVVISQFRGEFNLLDKAPEDEGGGRPSGGQRRDQGQQGGARSGAGNNGGAPPLNSGGYRGDGMSGQQQPAGGGGGWGSGGDLDDEIPFGPCVD